MRVDGFRFDLATILAREPYGFDEGGGFLNACRQDPVLCEELDVKDVTWPSPTGEEMADEQWQDSNARSFGMLLDGRAQESGIKRRASDATCC